MSSSDAQSASHERLLAAASSVCNCGDPPCVDELMDAAVALRAVVKLHAPRDGVCLGCPGELERGEYTWWEQCPTFAAIAETMFRESAGRFIEENAAPLTRLPD